LGSLVAQHLAIPGVPEDEISLLVGDEDPVRGLLVELPKPGFALTQSLFGEPARPPYLGLAQLALERRWEPREIVLHDIVVRAGLHHVDGDVLPDRARNENERDVAPGLARDRERLAPAELRHGEIRDDEMRLELVQLATKVRFALHPAALEGEPSAFQLALDQLGVGFAVLRKQYPERFSHVAPAPRFSPARDERYALASMKSVGKNGQTGALSVSGWTIL